MSDHLWTSTEVTLLAVCVFFYGACFSMVLCSCIKSCIKCCYSRRKSSSAGDLEAQKESEVSEPIRATENAQPPVTTTAATIATAPTIPAPPMLTGPSFTTPTWAKTVTPPATSAALSSHPPSSAMSPTTMWSPESSQAQMAAAAAAVTSPKTKAYQPKVEDVSEEVAVDPMSSTFGSGRNMAAMYK